MSFDFSTLGERRQDLDSGRFLRLRLGFDLCYWSESEYSEDDRGGLFHEFILFVLPR